LIDFLSFFHLFLIQFNGRLLNRERIILGNNYEFPSNDQCDWNNEIGRRCVLRAIDLNTWAIVFVRSNAQVAEKFADQMSQCSKQMGIRVGQPIVVELNDDRTDTYIKEIKRNLNDQVQMVVIIFPTSRDDRYSAVKRLCCIDNPVPSQVIIAKTIFDEKKLRSVTQKILLQMNCKLGGELWRLEIPIKKLMVIGIDVYHQTEKRYKSIAGFVSSLNNEQTRWYSKICFQMVGQELVDSLKVAFSNAIKQYYEVNNYFPEKIVIFRDGVSEGQFSYVVEHEVKQLRTCFGENYSPKMSVVIVQKRINARIFGNAVCRTFLEEEFCFRKILKEIVVVRNQGSTWFKKRIEKSGTRHNC
jgi:aubergine-like protein